LNPRFRPLTGYANFGRFFDIEHSGSDRLPQREGMPALTAWTSEGNCVVHFRLLQVNVRMEISNQQFMTRRTSPFFNHTRAPFRGVKQNSEYRLFQEASFDQSRRVTFFTSASNASVVQANDIIIKPP